MSATFSTLYAQEFLKSLTYNASTWSSTSEAAYLSTVAAGAYAVLLSTSGNGLTSYLSTDTKIISVSDSVSWSGAVDGAIQAQYAFSTVANAGVPLEVHIARLYSGTYYPICGGTVSASGGGGALIGSTASYSSGNRTYLGTLVVPADNSGTLRLNTALRNVMLTKMTAGGADVGMGDGGTLSFYDGTQPASADDAVPGGSTLLASHTMSSAAWPAVSGRARTYPSSAIQLTASADASGTATWARLTLGSYSMDFGVDATAGDIVIPAAFSVGVAKNWTSNALTLTWP